jgi:hypothetical protein
MNHTPGPWTIAGQFDAEVSVSIIAVTTPENVARGEGPFICEVEPFLEEWTEQEIAKAEGR